MNSNNSLDERINEAAKILIDNGWSYLDCIRVLKSTTPEYSIRAVETERSLNTVPALCYVPRTPTDGGTEFNSVTTVRNTETPQYVITSQDIRKGL